MSLCCRLEVDLQGQGGKGRLVEWKVGSLRSYASFRPLAVVSMRVVVNQDSL